MIAEAGLAPEQYDSLPEVAEPSENMHLVGHQAEIEYLLRAYQSGRLHHALLLCGPRGIGKATLAFAFARFLLGNPDEATTPAEMVPPDSGSALVRQIANGSHPSLLHITRPLDKDGKKYKTAITVDEIRRLSKFLAMTSHDGGFRVIVVDPADDLNANAANALLKNLEEPPPRTVFMLISHAPGRLLATIRSRCQSFRLQPLAGSDVLSVLDHLGETLPEDDAVRTQLIEQSMGSPRNALLLTRYGGMELADAVDALLTGPQFDVEQANKLADAVGGRDATIQYSIVNETIMERIAQHAARAVSAHQYQQANRLADFWSDAHSTFGQAEAFNLDKKQYLVGLISKLRNQLNG